MWSVIVFELSRVQNTHVTIYSSIDTSSVIVNTNIELGKSKSQGSMKAIGKLHKNYQQANSLRLTAYMP